VEYIFRGAFIEKDLQKGKKWNEYFLSRAHKQVLAVTKNMDLILNSLFKILSSTETLVTVAISTAPDGGFHCNSMCSQAQPAHNPHNMLREIKVQIARRAPPYCTRVRESA